jgi:hypothetical protein
MTETFRRAAQDHVSTRSQTKFFGDFRAELGKRIAELELSLPVVLAPYFSIDSVHAGTTDLKMRLTRLIDESELILMVICRYHHTDEKYGNIHIEIALSGLSREKKTHFLGRFVVTEKKKIEAALTKVLLDGMRVGG